MGHFGLRQDKLGSILGNLGFHCLFCRHRFRTALLRFGTGHARIGFDIPDLEEMLMNVGLRPSRSSSYAKFFTEMLELAINFAYVKVLSKKSKAKVEEGTIAPTTREQLRSVQKSYQLYALIYPFFWTISQLDRLLFFNRGYAVIVEAKR